MASYACTESGETEERENPFKALGFRFGGSAIRRYDRVNDVKFSDGIEYKLGRNTAAPVP